jgi:hypothetical protein
VKGDRGGRVVAQSRPAHTAAAPGLEIALTLKRRTGG